MKVFGEAARRDDGHGQRGKGTVVTGPLPGDREKSARGGRSGTTTASRTVANYTMRNVFDSRGRTGLLHGCVWMKLNFIDVLYVSAPIIGVALGFLLLHVYR